MNCEILSTLYVKSNGAILCQCDAGEQVLLGEILPSDLSWDISEVFVNSKYTHIRTSLSTNNAPWGEICTKCSFFRKDELYSDNLALKQVNKIQIEPSLSCNLTCPCCSNMSQRRTRPKPHLLKLDVLEMLLQSLSEQSYSVGEILYAGQGEPLMHPHFSEIVRRFRIYYPNSNQLLCTNGNFDYWKTTQGEFIDTIYVSCDGLFQDSYEKYRVGGDVSKAIKFMQDVPKTINGKKQHLIWKYILFEFNDSDEEINSAQRLADSLGVDTLLFVFTHSRFKSIKYQPENVADFPIMYSNVTTSATPQVQNTNEKYRYLFKQGLIKSSQTNMLTSIRGVILQILKSVALR